MGNESDKKEYLYKSINRNWYELPVDTSAEGFCKLVNNSGKLQAKLTRGQIQSAVNHLCFDSENEKKDKRDKVGLDVKNAIYRDIYLWYLENRSETENACFGLKEAKKGNRTPSRFYWETRDLLTALAIAFSKDTGLKNEDLAQQSLKEFGLLLGEKSVADVESDVIAQKFLVDRSIQENMVMSFEKDLEKRLRAVWDLSHQIASQDMGKAMMETLRKLDIILLELADLKEKQSEEDKECQLSGEGTGRKPTAYEEIERLYKEALDLRKSMQQRDTSNKSGTVAEKHMHFTLSAGEENEKLLKDIEVLLEKYSRGNKKKVEAEFEVLYKRYLLAHENRPDRTQAAVSFLKDYQKLEQYAHGKSAIVEFAEQFRQELYSFARDIFDSTDRSYMDFRTLLDNTFHYANDAFAYGRLYSVHQEIWNEINIPIWLIRIQKVFLFIGRNEVPFGPEVTPTMQLIVRLVRQEFLNYAIRPQIILLRSAVREMRNLLHRRYPNHDLLFSNDIEVIVRFVSAYNKASRSVYCQRETSRSEVESYYTNMMRNPCEVDCNDLSVMCAEVIIMEMECKVLAAALIDEAVDRIKKEHNKLEPLLESYGEHN